MGKRYLVTGATGFIGSSLVRRLTADGEDVHVLTRESSNRWRISDVLDRVVEHDADLRDEAGVRRAVSGIRPDVIFHCAAYGTVPGQHDAFQLAETNLVGTVNLVEALVDVGFECLINTGSSSEYGEKAGPMSEDDILAPMAVYGATKAAATLYCHAVGRAKQQPIITLRVFSPFGPYDEPTHLIPTVIRKCLAGEDIELTLGDETRDFYHIDDLVDLYVRVPGSRWSPGEIVNAGSGTQHSVREVVTTVMELTGSDSQPLWGRFAPRDFDTDQWVADVTKARAVFGWSPAVSFDDGLQRTIDWHRAVKDGHG